jgi:amino acid adenylation domain-containing protein
VAPTDRARGASQLSTRNSEPESVTVPTVHRIVQFPTDTERSSASGFEPACSAWCELDIPRGPLDRARQSQLLGAIFALLHRYTHQGTIALDVHIEGYGLCQLDVEVAGDAPIAAVIDASYRALEDAAASSARGAIRPANVAASFMASAGPEGTVDVTAYIAACHTSYDVHFIVAQAQDAIVFALAYNAKLILPSSANRLMASFGALLDGALRDRTSAVERLPLLGPEELRALTAAQDAGATADPPSPVHRLFEAFAKAQPHALAASLQGHSLTYAALDMRSSQLARHLLANGVEPGVAVGVCVRPSVDVLVGMLAIWKARGIYLPLDPTHPKALVERMLAEARPRFVLTTSALSPLTDGFPQLFFDADAALLEGQEVTAPAVEPLLDDPACLFFTSGTTGKAKGVLTTQGNLAHYINAAARNYGFCVDDVFVSVARYTFSISLFELLSPLCCGGSLRILDRDEVLTPDRLGGALEEVTVLHAGPSLLGSLFRYLRSPQSPRNSLPRMRHASSGGDMVPPAVMEEMRRVFPNAELFVIYGCTEVSCMGTTFPVARQTTVARTLVGRPFPDVTVQVLDANRTLVPFGVVGEICIAGKGVARGYLDRPELTAQRFWHRDGRRFYQTGDVGRLHADGNLEILGRRDFQVQLRGIRIELAGIEKTVLELGLAAQCMVVARTFDEGDLRLVAFVVKPSDARLSPFRRALASQLPDYMVPNHLVVLEAFPLTVNGKIDRNQLKEMPLAPLLASEIGARPANEREETIAGVFAQVLGVREVGVEDGFFDLGGDSLRGVVALEEIERAIGVAIPPHVLFEKGTARALAEHAASEGVREPRPILLGATASGPPLFMLSGVHIYRDLARRLDGRYASYGVFASREVESFDAANARHSVEDLARDYVQIIRRQQPSGPYRLLGFSFAGIVAYEVAQQLRAAGDEVRFLAMLDAALPEWTLGWRFRLSQLGRVISASPRDVTSFVVRRLREGRKSGQEEFGRYRLDETLGPLEERRDAVNREAAAHYMARIRPLPGNVLLVVSGDRLRNDPLKSPSYGWGSYLPQLDIHTVEADHFRMMSDDPYVTEVARALANGMDEAKTPA